MESVAPLPRTDDTYFASRLLAVKCFIEDVLHQDIEEREVKCLEVVALHRAARNGQASMVARLLNAGTMVRLADH
jgi:hypothetical protein